VDPGADRTLLIAELTDNLRLPTKPLSDAELTGIGGGASSMLVNSAIEFKTVDSKSVVVRGELAILADARAIDLSILGRDVLNNFDVIISRHRNEVLLLAPRHAYQVIVT
jgi:hypothetical protein